MRSMSNQEIMDGIVTGNEKILKSFYRKNLPFVRQHILLHQGNEADVEDIFQDALVLVYQKLRDNALDINTTIEAYFHGICKNLWRNQLRSTQKMVCYDHPIPDSIKNVDVGSYDIQNSQREQLLQKYLTQLSTSAQNIWYMFLDGSSTQTIAEELGFTEGYVRKNKCNSKKSLSTMIQQDQAYQEMMSFEIRN